MPILADPPRDEVLHRLRHSLAHVLAQAVQALHPGTKLGFGPPVDDGFYYDFLLPRPLSDDDLPVLEERMRQILAERQRFTREELPAADAFDRIEKMGEPHKLEYARELVSKQGLPSLSFYTNGSFVDLCEGPHVDDTAQLPADAFRLHSLTGAYWRGDERNAMLTRIYAWAFRTKQELDAHEEAHRVARERDHRKLGAQLRIFTLSDEVGKGLPLWLPNGTALRLELEKLAHEMEFRAGYQRVSTPHITKRELYVKSGHIPLYEDSIYPPMRMREEAAAGGSRAEEGSGELAEYYLKPMNCPHHHLIFAAEKRSYRDLPLRLAEYGTQYRFERAGALQGLSRVRGMTINDAHLYVTPDQLKDEIQAVMKLHQAYYELFGLTDYYLRLSTWNPNDPKRASKFVDDPDAWAFSERVVAEALDGLGLSYRIGAGEAAFYGPKIDYQFRTVVGREFTVSTNQLDFAIPGRFGLSYTDRDGAEKTPYCIHRAPLSTHERFIAFLLEHYGGAFPTWLAPVQVRVIPVSEKFAAYARTLHTRLRDALVRSELADQNEPMGKRIRAAAVDKVPLVAVVGGREETDQTVSLRRYGVEAQKVMPTDAFLAMLHDEIATRRHRKGWDS